MIQARAKNASRFGPNLTYFFEYDNESHAFFIDPTHQGLTNFGVEVCNFKSISSKELTLKKVLNFL
jgi:hypothetical protein